MRSGSSAACAGTEANTVSAESARTPRRSDFVSRPDPLNVMQLSVSNPKYVGIPSGFGSRKAPLLIQCEAFLLGYSRLSGSQISHAGEPISRLRD
jgi:hypothetical protein